MLTFKPQSVKTTETIAYVSYIILLLAVLGAIFMEWKKRRRP